MASESTRLADSEQDQAIGESVEYNGSHFIGGNTLRCMGSEASAEKPSEQTPEPAVEVGGEQSEENAKSKDTPTSVLMTQATESTPMLPGLSLQNLQAVGDVSPSESHDSGSSASDSSLSESQRPYSLIRALQSRPQTAYLRYSDGGAAPQQAHGTTPQGVSAYLEDNLGPGCTTAKNQNCSVHYPKDTAKQWLQFQADQLRAEMQGDFRAHDRECAGYERQYKFLSKKYGEADTKAKLDHHKRMVLTLGPMVRALDIGRTKIALQDDDDGEWDDDFD